MKNKNDFKNEPDVVHPIACVYCQHTGFEAVQVHGMHGNFITRLFELTTLHSFMPQFAKAHRLYGWRCLYCGYVMWFTERHLG